MEGEKKVKGYFRVQDRMKSRLRSGELFFHLKLLKEKGLVMSEREDFLFQITLFLTEEEWKKVKEFQKIDIFPGQRFICRKDLLHITLTRRKQKHPLLYSFWPEGFLLPNQMEEFKTKFKEEYEGNTPFILKPFNASCGNKV